MADQGSMKLKKELPVLAQARRPISDMRLRLPLHYALAGVRRAEKDPRGFSVEHG